MKKKKRKNLKLNLSNVYIIITMIFIFGFGFFGVSKIFIAEETIINQTELYKEYDLRANGKFTINSWVYDKEKNMMEIILTTNGIKDYSSELNFSAISKKDLKNELPLEVVFNDNDFYIIHLKDIPKNFDQVAVRLHKTDKNIRDIFEEDQNKLEQDTKTISTIYTDERVVDSSEIKEKDIKKYALQITDTLIEKSLEDKKEFESKIDKIEKFNEELNLEIERLQSELLYETLEEQNETNNSIYQLEREIEQNNKLKEEQNLNIKIIEEKVKRLNQKKQDLSF